jgi:RHS repeat-associated protein
VTRRHPGRDPAPERCHRLGLLHSLRSVKYAPPSHPPERQYPDVDLELRPLRHGCANTNPAGAGTFAYNLRFPGQIFDGQAGIHQNGFRDFDPAIGRYAESDPIGLFGGSYSTYAYVDGKPASVTDPLGLASRVRPVLSPPFPPYCHPTSRFRQPRKTIPGSSRSGIGGRVPTRLQFLRALRLHPHKGAELRCPLRTPILRRRKPSHSCPIRSTEIRMGRIAVDSLRRLGYCARNLHGERLT